MMKYLQKLGKALMLPVAVLPICGILMGLGYALAPGVMGVPGAPTSGAAYTVGFLLVKAGGALIDNMAWLFAIGAAVGLADNDGTAGLAGLVSFLMMQQLLNPGVVGMVRHLEEGTATYIAFQKVAGNSFIGILAAVVGYYLIHEGAHFLYALLTGVFKQIKFMGLGVQIDVYAERMTDTQLGLFCLAGALATFLAAYLLAALAKRICRMKSKLLRAMLYYITIALLLIDPLYLSALCGLFGGGDMNGIALLCPEWAVRCLSGALLIANALVFWRWIFPVYRQSFSERRTA